MIKRLIVLCVPALMTVAGVLSVVPNAMAVTANHSASTVISNRPDGGNNDNPTSGVNQTWANDSFTRNASLHLVGEVGLSHCGGSTPTGHCYEFTAAVRDSGKFKVNPTSLSGSQSPGVGDGGVVPLYVPLTGSFSGNATYDFFSSWKTADRKPSVSENDNGSLPKFRHTTGRWPMMFFRSSGPSFWDTTGSPVTISTGSLLLNNWGWNYSAPTGSDSQCANEVSFWSDTSANSAGSLSSDGNILAPDAAHCV